LRLLGRAGYAPRSRRFTPLFRLETGTEESQIRATVVLIPCWKGLVYAARLKIALSFYCLAMVNAQFQTVRGIVRPAVTPVSFRSRVIAAGKNGPIGPDMRQPPFHHLPADENPPESAFPLSG